MGGDNFNKENRESGNDSKSDASKLMAAINAGKKHRESTPERLEKEAEKLLNSIVDRFIVESDMYSTIEKAATEGKSSTYIGHNNLTKLFPDFQSFTEMEHDGRHSKFYIVPKTIGGGSHKVLSISDKGGSGLSASRNVRDFSNLITIKFSEVASVSMSNTWFSKVSEGATNMMFLIDWQKTD
jgi:hypothetical protein